MGRFVYFAYGSNMLSERLRAASRCPSAEVIGTATARDFSVCFGKRSTDGSGKAALVPQTGATACGVLFSIDLSERVSLDAVEGHGYRPVDDFPVIQLGSREARKVRTYVAIEDYLDQKLSPYDWYLALAVAGATQSRLPSAYVDALRAVRTIMDCEPMRSTRQEALQILKQSGFNELLSVTRLRPNATI
jgi:gamma-glutamylcyclotransferase